MYLPGPDPEILLLPVHHVFNKSRPYIGDDKPGNIGEYPPDARPGL